MSNVSNMLGGYEAWVAAGLATESGKAKTSAATGRKKK
jgi:3-mercaptopyruvate sulfurtransferase SseA